MNWIGSTPFASKMKEPCRRAGRSSFCAAGTFLLPGSTRIPVPWISWTKAGGNRESGLFYLVNADGTMECMDGLTYIKGRGKYHLGAGQEALQRQAGERPRFFSVWGFPADGALGQRIRRQQSAQSAGVRDGAGSGEWPIRLRRHGWICI